MNVILCFVACSVDTHSRVVVAEAGCVLEALDQHLASFDLMMPIDLGAKGRFVQPRSITLLKHTHTVQSHTQIHIHTYTQPSKHMHTHTCTQNIRKHCEFAAVKLVVTWQQTRGGCVFFVMGHCAAPCLVSRQFSPMEP